MARIRVRNILREALAKDFAIMPAEYSDEAFYDSDGYSIWEQAHSIAQSSGIHISRNKELAFVAMDGEEVIGATWKDIYRDDNYDEQEVYVYDFDMAIRKDYREDLRAFFGLMRASLDDFEDSKDYYDNLYIRTWVINPKLVRVLERKYGFEIESEHGDNSAHMVKY